jgi:hypothetical protein
MGAGGGTVPYRTVYRTLCVMRYAYPGELYEVSVGCLVGARKDGWTALEGVCGGFGLGGGGEGGRRGGWADVS